jgi:hypothetical protein
MNLTLNRTALFETVSFDEGAKDWVFIFAENILIEVSGFWRLLENTKIVLVSLDHGHQFGLAKPLNLVEEVTTILNEKKLLELKVDENTADLTLVLTDGLEIEILIASAGYETYQFSISGKTYIGLGSGEIAIF